MLPAAVGRVQGFPAGPLGQFTPGRYRPGFGGQMGRWRETTGGSLEEGFGRLTPAEADRYVALARRHIENIEASGGPPKDARPRWDEGKRMLAAVEQALVTQELGVFPGLWIGRVLWMAAGALGVSFFGKGPALLVGNLATLMKWAVLGVFGVFLYQATTSRKPVRR